MPAGRTAANYDRRAFAALDPSRNAQVDDLDGVARGAMAVGALVLALEALRDLSPNAGPPRLRHRCSELKGLAEIFEVDRAQDDSRRRASFLVQHGDRLILEQGEPREKLRLTGLAQ